MRFSELTTLGVGGEIREFVEASSNADVLAAASRAGSAGMPLLVVGDGSNLLVSDDDFEGMAVAIRTSGVDVNVEPEGFVRVRVAAGESWDSLVQWTVEQGYSGLEALSGIPGRVGAAPIQNIGAYGQEVSQTISAVDILDLELGDIRRLNPQDMEFVYRDSVFKRGLKAIVLSVEFTLTDARTSRLSRPIEFVQLANALGVNVGEVTELSRAREHVLALRRVKGMVLDSADSDTRSAGSFFVNPIVTERFARSLPADAPRFPVTDDASDRVLEIGAEVPPLAEPSLVKLSAAWLIEKAGVAKGFSLPGSRAAVSSKHSLALCNRGGATAEEIAGLARYVRSLVQSHFGILLQPEPQCIGVEL